jgi:hypothetical protein
MRRLSLLFCLALLAGCGRSFESQIEGTWHVDADSVYTPRVTPGADKKPEWIDATRGLANVNVTFTKDGQITAKGFGAASQSQWTLRGTTIVIEDSKEKWPDMSFDPKSGRIHLIIERGEDTLKMDLVK